MLVTGFMAEHTLGRKLVDKLPEVPIFGELLRLRAEVAKLNELSGHADQHELLAWLKPMAKGLKKVFVVHGEPAQSQALAKAIKDRFGLEAVIPHPWPELRFELKRFTADRNPPSPHANVSHVGYPASLVGPPFLRRADFRYATHLHN